MSGQNVPAVRGKTETNKQTWVIVNKVKAVYTENEAPDKRFL